MRTKYLTTLNHWRRDAVAGMRKITGISRLTATGRREIREFFRIAASLNAIRRESGNWCSRFKRK